MTVPLWWPYYDASRLSYVPFPLVFAYLSGIYKACSDDNGRVSMIAHTERLLMTLACFFATNQDGH